MLRRVAPNIALLCISLLITAWAADLLVYLRPPKDPLERRTELRRQAARNAGLDSFDERSEAEVARDLRAAGTRTYPIANGLTIRETRPELVDSFFPLGGIAGVTTVLCGELGRHVVYQSDRFGFRNPPEAWQSPRVALVGDSFAAGMCVESYDTPLAALRRRGVHAVALGFRGAGPVTELALLREYVAPLRPPVVVWAYFEGNDLENLREAAFPVLGRYLEPGFSQRLRERQSDTDTLVANWVEREQARFERNEANRRPEPFSRKAAKVIKLWHLRQLVTALLAPPPTEQAFDFALFERVLRQARDEVREWGGEMRLVYLPSSGALGRTSGEDQRGVAAYPEVVAIACRLDLPVLDLRRRMMERPDHDSLYPEPAFPGVHFSARGFRIFGEELAASLNNERASDCAT